MQKRSASFFVLSLVAAVLATGCAHKKSAEEGTTAQSTPAAPLRQTADVEATGAKWAQVEAGPLTVVGLTGVGRFDGQAECYASAGPSCPNASSSPADFGTRVYMCSGTCSAENGGKVEAGKMLCCGPVKGNGGKLRVSFMK